MPTRRNLKPPETVEQQSLMRFKMNAQEMSPRQFRDALTKAGPNPSIPGIKTGLSNWGRWTP